MATLARRLSIPLNDDQHQLVKLTALLNGQSIKDYVLSKLFDEKTPNAITIKAMRDLETNSNLHHSKTVDEMFNKILKISKPEK
ncbi:MAG: hypothetical protein KBD83_04690 [Gammaproteobacteria bacterium]|nr:hypothetical protein [Gammaproteobacteria bacterium]